MLLSYNLKKWYEEIIIRLLYNCDTNFLLTELEGRTEEYRLEVVTVRTADKKFLKNFKK